MARSLLICLILIVAVGAARAQVRPVEDGVAHCANISNSKKRLACYDKIADDLKRGTAGLNGTPGTNAPSARAGVIEGFRPTGHGEWVVREAVSGDGSKDVALAIFTTGLAGGASSGGLRVTLWLRCFDDKTLLYIDWNAIVDIGGRSVVRVQTQIDNAAPVENHWARYSNHNVTGLYGRRASVKLIQRLFGRTLLKAELIEQSAAYSAQFNVTGLEQAIAPLRAACDW